MANFGFRILPRVRRPKSRLLAELGALATSLTSDNMHRLHLMSAKLRPFHRKGTLDRTWVDRSLRDQGCDF